MVKNLNQLSCLDFFFFYKGNVWIIYIYRGCIHTHRDKRIFNKKSNAKLSIKWGNKNGWIYIRFVKVEPLTLAGPWVNRPNPIHHGWVAKNIN